MRHTARNAAVQALLQVEENEGYSNLVLDKVLKAFQLERRDSALTSILFYGVLEKKITLDFYLQHCLKAPEKKNERSGGNDPALRSLSDFVFGQAS